MVALLVPPRPSPIVGYVQLAPNKPEAQDLTPYGAGRREAGPVPVRRATRPPAPPVAARRADTAAATPGPVERAAAPAAPAPLVLGPEPGDGRLWVSPRPALPAAVAERLYAETTGRDSVAVSRLRAMVDSLNEIIDAEQRARRLPTWTTEVAGRTIGIDSQYIHILGIKIPTLALALLPVSLPQGNYDEMMRARQLAYMREDLLRAAQRAQTLDDFKRYVRELRARKDAEREAERRQRGDTVKVTP